MLSLTFSVLLPLYYYYAECRYSECRYAKCRYAECAGASAFPQIID
jgi:hypothetical protein